MANAKHELVSFSYTIDPAPIGTQTLGVVLVLLADLNLDGTAARTKTFSSDTEIDTAVTAAEMTAAQGAALKKAFAQIPAAEKVRAGNVDLIGLETYATAYAALKAETTDYFYVTAETRTVADQLALASALASDFAIYIAQTSDASALTGLAGVNAVYTNTTQENFVLVYHPTDTEFLDVAWAAARGTFDPDRKSVGWQGIVRGIAAYPDGSVDSSERDLAKAGNVNLMLDFSTQAGYVSPGRTYTGRQIKNMVSVFWYVIRATEEMIRTKLARDAEGDLVPVDRDGQAIVRNVLTGQYDLGVAAKHFKAGQQLLTFPDPIPQADIDAAEIKTLKHRITTLQNAETFDLSVAFTREDVIVTVTEA